MYWLIDWLIEWNIGNGRQCDWNKRQSRSSETRTTSRKHDRRDVTSIAEDDVVGCHDDDRWLSWRSPQPCVCCRWPVTSRATWITHGTRRRLTTPAPRRRGAIHRSSSSFTTGWAVSCLPPYFFIVALWRAISEHFSWTYFSFRIDLCYFGQFSAICTLCPKPKCFCHIFY